MLLERQNVDEIADLYLDHAIPELQPRRSLEHDDPFVLILIVPKALGRGVTVRDNPLDSDVPCIEQCRQKLVRLARREVGK